MKTSLDIPEELYRSVKVKAAQEGRKVSDLVADGLRLLLNAPAPAPKHRVQFPLIPERPGSKHVITDEMVYAAEAEVWEEEAERAAALMRR